MAFLQALHRHLRRKFILILDRYSAHRKEAHPDWVEVVWLPTYAPELNPCGDGLFPPNGPEVVMLL